MSYKNIDELRAAQKKWNNSRLQARNPSGFKKHKEAVAAFNSSNSSKPSTPQPTESKKTGNDSPKYTPKASETKRTSKILKDTRAAAAAVKNYKPERLNVERNVYSNDLPKRPNVPKLPKLNIPGGMSSSRVDKPSGLPGKINKYKPTGNYSKPEKPSTPKPSVYTNDLVKSRVDRAKEDGQVTPTELRRISNAVKGAVKVGGITDAQRKNTFNSLNDNSTPKRNINLQIKDAQAENSGFVPNKKIKDLKRSARSAGLGKNFVDNSFMRNLSKNYGGKPKSLGKPNKGTS
tara:strand:+ start:10635 stop:11504 length:870 start_codon:yes stop_codon:yes gene_type:complete